MLNAGIIGASGYAGAELVRLLSMHPKARPAFLSSVSFEGRQINEIYPSLSGLCELSLSDADSVIEKSDLVFACLPHGKSQSLAEKCLARGLPFIDLGADFRLESGEEFESWYGTAFENEELHKKAVYGLPELFREKIASASLIANPGCYPTAASLALFPALRLGLIEKDGIIIDAKSGVTGAGRGLSQRTHFPECCGAFSAYKAGTHRHTPEIEQTLSGVAGEKIKILFVPHLLPVSRGILSTAYARLKEGVGEEEIRSAYGQAYEGEKFVRLLKPGESADIKNVRYGNYCDISLHTDSRSGTLIVVSAIDNLVKGAAGQAVQNMNLISGFPEDSGLCLAPAAF